jgi:hypothetical protein
MVAGAYTLRLGIVNYLLVFFSLQAGELTTLVESWSYHDAAAVGEGATTPAGRAGMRSTLDSILGAHGALEAKATAFAQSHVSLVAVVPRFGSGRGDGRGAGGLGVHEVFQPYVQSAACAWGQGSDHWLAPQPNASTRRS